eukprot:2965105-Rhodomonas_salina.1
MASKSTSRRLPGTQTAQRRCVIAHTAEILRPVRAGFAVVFVKSSSFSANDASLSSQDHPRCRSVCLYPSSTSDKKKKSNARTDAVQSVPVRRGNAVELAARASCRARGSTEQTAFSVQFVPETRLISQCSRASASEQRHAGRLVRLERTLTGA